LVTINDERIALKVLEIEVEKEKENIACCYFCAYKSVKDEVSFTEPRVPM
jgi:hypothetical protein